MAAEYTIYLVNQSKQTKTFWAFLQPPDELKGNPNVFANSKINLDVDPNSPATNTFTIPVQYIAGGGSSNKAVGLGIKIDAFVSNNIELQETWEIDYVTVTEDCRGKKAPTMSKIDSPAPENMIALKSNAFDQSANEDCKWYSSMSFGIQTDNGFIGMSWSPSPNETRTLTPKLAFYVTTGDYGENELASWTEVANDAAVIELKDFKAREATVILTSSGKFKVVPGKPSQELLTAPLNFVDNLIDSHKLLLASLTDLWHSAKNQEQANLLSSGFSSLGGTQDDQLIKVTWSSTFEDDDTNTFLAGTLAVKTPLTAAFGIFVLSGVEFNITSQTGGQTKVNFTYSGSQSADKIKQLFVAGAKLLFKNS
jgi:hypothetical protein